ncbi:MAG: NAD-dependent DNA ligase LigA [Saprospiraceae bacterium]
MGYATDAAGTNLLDSLETHYESLDLLATLGFKVPMDGTERKLCSNIEEVTTFCSEWESRREAYPYEVDGMVVKVNDRRLQERAGYTSHHPRAIAYKFAARQATTQLLSVEYQIGKIGSVTPVAKVAPVSLAGVTISSISLHNEDFIREKDLRLGDTVLIERAGDVIPYIVKAMEDLRTGEEIPVQFPANCPSCQTALVRAEGEAAWRCPNYDCPEQVLQRIIFHVSKPAMDIEGFGKQIVERFMELGWIRSLPDIYRLDYNQIAQLEGFGEKSAANLKAAIEKAKQNPIHRLLHSLSIHHLGKKAAFLIASEINHVLDLKNWTIDDFLHIKDIGPTVAENVQAFFRQSENIAMLETLASLGVNLTATDDDRPVAAASDGPLVGKTILFTGTLLQMSRKEAQEKAAAAGAKNISAVSGNLDILVVGETAGSKLKKAEALGTVTIYTEAAFLDLLKGGED